ncbi:MAG: DegT/DnrJ/EryC1/StrS family aminotransferase [Sedimentisphaerales bacterium]|nr:DegT/DnrJ/EryC1/StrS family aminotransferase [Sedimentisphaerales bacterium]
MKGFRDKKTKSKEPIPNFRPVMGKERAVVAETPIRVSKRDELIKKLKEKNIGREIYYPVPMHIQECFMYLSYKEGDFPEAEKAAKEVLAIPIYPELNDAMKNYMVETVLAFLRL